MNPTLIIGLGGIGTRIATNVSIMKHKRTILRLLLLLLLCPLALTAQDENTKPKRIFITLDVSMSMEGNRYNMANYTAQTISVFSNPDDQLIVYYLNEKHDLGKKGYKDLHKSFESLPPKKKNYHEIKDLLTFMTDYKPNAKYQDWLFIIGDGVWKWTKAQEDFDQTTQKFSDFVDENQIQVCYLQTGDSQSDTNSFTSFLESLTSSKIDVQRSDTTATSVLGQCTYFANKILGFSNTNIKINQESDQCATFNSEFPLNRFLLVYQSNSLSKDDLKLESVEFLGNGIAYKLKGNPTTKPLVKKGEPYLSGAVWEMEYLQTIPAKEIIKVCFSQNIDVANVNVYPYVDVVLNVKPCNTESDPLNSVGKNFFEICKKDKEVVIVVEATDSQGRKFEPPLMQKMDIKVFVGSDMKQAAYRASDTTFVVSLPMTDESVSYHAVVESPGYFSRITETQTVVKSDNCPLTKVPMITLPVQIFEPVPFKELIGGESFGGSVDDTLFQQLCGIGEFDVQKVESINPWYSEEASFALDDTIVRLAQKPNSKWCECAYPDTLQYVVTLKSNDGIPLGEYLYQGFTIPISVPVDKRAWIVRCKDYLIFGGSLLVFVLYLVALLKKNRFKKDARIIPTYMELRGGVYRENKNDKGKKLRKKSFGAWFRRWLVPFIDEKRFMEWQLPPAGFITFVADKSKDKVNITRSSFNSSKMKMSGFDSNDTSKLVEMDDIQVYTGKKYEGKLSFEPGGVDDEKGYRVFIILLILSTLIAEGLIVCTLIKALL